MGSGIKRQAGLKIEQLRFGPAVRTAIPGQQKDPQKLEKFGNCEQSFSGVKRTELG